MLSISYLQKTIYCPVCKRQQTMERVIGHIWIPVAPFCCDIMRNSDTPEWNALIEEALNA